MPNIGYHIQDGIDEMSSVINRLPSTSVSIEIQDQGPQARSRLSKTICISGKFHSPKKKSDFEDPLRAVGNALVDKVATYLTTDGDFQAQG